MPRACPISDSHDHTLLQYYFVLIYSSKKLGTRLLPVTQSGVSAPASECPVSETLQGTKPLSEITFDNNQKVNPSELLSEVAKAVAVDITLGVSHKFKSHMFRVVGDAWSVLSLSQALFLGAQTSVDRLYELVVWPNDNGSLCT
jgi:hypothetical protein